MPTLHDTPENNTPLFEGVKLKESVDGYYAIHRWVYKNKKRPNKCQDCSKRKRLEAANISNKYLKDVKDWKWLCRKCHMESDGRLSNFKKSSRNSKTGYKNKQTLAKEFIELRVKGMTFGEISRLYKRSSEASISNLIKRYEKRQQAKAL